MSRSIFALLARRFDPVVRERHRQFSRREVLKGIAALGAGGLMSTWLLRSGGAARAAHLMGHRRSRAGDPRRVIVVGAGFAGLACAYELATAGLDVRVFEARKRPGGRVLTFDTWVEGAQVEAGGEFIGVNHPHWLAYAERFDLDLRAVEENEDLHAPVYLDGKALSFDDAEHLYGEIALAFSSLNEPAAKVNEDEPWHSEHASELDRKSLADWAGELNVSPRSMLAIKSMMTADNGVPLERASLLGMLACIKGHGLERYWTDTETHRCAGGNQRLAEKFVEGIGPERVAYASPVSAIDVSPLGATVTLKDGTTHESEEVVLAVPPSVYASIAIRPALPAALTPQMGTAAKYLTRVRRRVWEAGSLSPDALCDGDITFTWDGTNGQGTTQAALMGFCGGPGAARLSAMPASTREAACAAQLGKVYNDLAGATLDARFIDWPGDPLVNAGYSFPAPGQVCVVGPLLARAHGPTEPGADASAGRLHLAGEHTCYKFVGYMEGALASGAAVAKRIALRDAAVGAGA